MRRSDPDFWFYKAQSLSEKVYLMRFSMNLKKCLPGLMLGGLALWFAGCGESTSTPTKPASTSPNVNGDGSLKGEGLGSKSNESSSAGAGKSSADDEQAGSSTGGREVPEAAPPDDKDEAK